MKNIRDVNVTNTVTSDAETDLLTASIGGVAVAGNVLLVYNDTDALAKAAAVTGNILNNMTISGTLSAKGVSMATGASVGGVSVGATINHVDVNSVNTADLDTNDFSLSIARILTVQAGEVQNTEVTRKASVFSTEAIADTIAGSAGLIAIGVNTAVARNRAQNNAYITGKDLNVNHVNVSAYGSGKAKAAVTGLTTGAINVATSVVNTMNEATSRAYVNLTGRMNGDLNVLSDVKGTTDADLYTGVGTLLGGVYTNVATARGRTASIARVNIGSEPSGRVSAYSVQSTGRNDVNTTIDNLEIYQGGILSVGTMIGRAFSTDVYDAELSLTGDKYELNSLSVTTDYETHVNAETTPSAAGSKIDLVGVGVNKATAKNKAYAMAKLQTQGVIGESGDDDRPTILEVWGDVIVKTQGSADAKAEVKPAAFQLDLAVGVGVNKAKADVSGTQAAVLQLGLGGIGYAKLVDVQSIVKKTDAQATVGASGASDRSRVKVSLISVDANSATANASLASTATVMGGITGKTTVDGLVKTGYWDVESKGYIDYDTAVVFDREYSYKVWLLVDGKTESGLSVLFHRIYDEDYNLLYIAQTVEECNEMVKYYQNLGYKNLQTRNDRTSIIQGEDGNYYLYQEKRMVWVEELTTGKVDVNLYEPEKNILNADALNIYAGMDKGKQSSAKANSNGAKSYGLVTVGDLNASAHTGESISAMFEGVTATIGGTASIKAASNTRSIATGYEPGGWAAANGTTSDAKSGVGTKDQKENVAVVIGTGASLTAARMDLTALNNGEAQSSIEKGKQNGVLAAISKGSLPTESWYDTLITIGKDASLEATRGNIILYTADTTKSTSKVKSSGFSVGVNYNSMKGENEVHQENNIDILDGASLTASRLGEGRVSIQAWQTTQAEAETKYDGTGAVVVSNTMKADNTVRRAVRVNIGDNVKIHADSERVGDVVVLASSGITNSKDDYLNNKNDRIYTHASVESLGFVGLANAEAHADIESTSEIVIGGGTEIDAYGRVWLEALSSSFPKAVTYKSSLAGREYEEFGDNEFGIVTEAETLSTGGISLPNAVAKNTLDFNTFISIHMRENWWDSASDLTTKITSRTDDVFIRASNERLKVRSRAETSGKGLAGASNANAWNDATLSNAVWIDDAELLAQKDLSILADNGGMSMSIMDIIKNPSIDEKSKEILKKNSLYTKELQPYFYAWSKSRLKALGEAKAHARITGSQINQIRSYGTDNVSMTSTNGTVRHYASEPNVSIRSFVEANSKVPKVFGIKLGKTKTREELIWYYFDRCDFCGTGTEYDVMPTEQMTLEKRYKEAYERALLPISDVTRMVDRIGAITRAHYGLFDDQTVASIFVLNIQHLLERDIRLTAVKMADYKLWTNSETDHTTYLLPTSAQMHMKGGQLDFVTEILQGDALGDGKARLISIYTAISSGAYARGIIPIGSTGTLNFRTGVLALPSHADYELYLHELSAGWLLKQLEGGMMRRATAPQESLNAYAMEGGDLPEMEYAETLIPDGQRNGCLIYWLGHTPETAADADETLIYLMVNSETDEIDAFRTSVNMLAAGDAPIDVSLFIYRDVKADRREEELYNVFFFDTPAGEMSLVKLITNTPGEEMLIPRSLQIELRKFRVKDSGETAFCLYDQVLILSTEENHRASALNGFYKATVKDDTFESAYLQITGISDGNLVVLVKKNQPIWPKWTDEENAQAIDGTCYRLIEGVWYETDEV